MRKPATESTPLKTVEVAAAWLTTEDSSVQLQLRPSTAKHDPGKLALFGGNVEDGETTDQAMCRELVEELDIDSSQMQPDSISDCRIDRLFEFESHQTGRSHLAVTAYKLMIPRLIPVRNQAIDGESRLFTASELVELSPKDMTLGACAVRDHLLRIGELTELAAIRFASLQ